MNSRLLFCFITCLSVFATSASAQFTGQYNALNITGSSNVLKTEIPLGAPATTGSNYLNEAWAPGEVVLKDGRSVGVYPVRIQIELGVVEIKVENKPYTLNFSNVSHILQTDDALGLVGKVQLGRRFSFEDEQLKGVVVTHEIEGSDTKVLNNYFIEFQPSNYNVAMDVGSKVNQKLTRQNLFVQKDGVLKQIKGSNKKIVSLMGYDKVKARETLRANHFDLQDPKDLMKFIRIME